MARDDEQKVIAINTTLNYELLEPNQFTRKAEVLLKAVSTNRVKTGKLHLGASMIALMDYQVSNTDSKFGYLMRHPTSNNQIGKTVSEATLHSAQVMLAGAVTNWLSLYTELLYDPEQSFGAGTFYSTLYAGRLRVVGAYALTENVWPGTQNPAPPLNVFAAHEVSSLVGGASYVLTDNGMYAFVLSGEFSNFLAGPAGSPWERQNQYILGGALQINNSSKLFIELFRTEGYAPLNFISGGNLENPGATHSDRDALSHGVVFGAQIVL